MCNWGNTIAILIDDKIVDVDKCIVPLVKALNNAGMKTIASCCGHGKQPSNIALEDGREIIIAPDFETGRKIDKCFPPIN
jgi:hypothetical protein